MTSSVAIAGAQRGGSIEPVEHRAVLVPLDGSAWSERALEPARWLAANLGGEVHTVVAGFVDDPDWYRSYVRSLRQAWPQTVPHFVGGFDVPAGIVDTARTLPGCLVCMGTRGRARTAAVLGSTFTSVARAHRRPLIAIGPNAGVPRRDARRVVACVDGTPTSEQILPLAAGWARRLDARLDILLVAERPISELRLATDVDVSTHVVSGRDLVDHLRDHPATLVATTSHLRTRFDRAVHGSAAARIIGAVPVPVLVQPHRLNPEREEPSHGPDRP